MATLRLTVKLANGSEIQTELAVPRDYLDVHAVLVDATEEGIAELVEKANKSTGDGDAGKRTKDGDAGKRTEDGDAGKRTEDGDTERAPAWCAQFSVGTHSVVNNDVPPEDHLFGPDSEVTLYNCMAQSDEDLAVEQALYRYCAKLFVKEHPAVLREYLASGERDELDTETSAGLEIRMLDNIKSYASAEAFEKALDALEYFVDDEDEIHSMP